MKIIQTPIGGLFEIYPQVFEDNRGYFLESFKEKAFVEAGIDRKWVQENQSYSKAGTVRGLHFQKAPFAQAKLVRVITGKVLDVAVDLRKDSSTFGKTFTQVLDATLHNMVYIPEGFAHGFSVLEDAVFSYKCTEYYNKESEGGILWNDPALMIDWKVSEPILSEKDKLWPTLEAFVNLSEGGL
ncbi:dTDP-4-dehydrorhamnose 3,5-epimerase [Mongoliitalea daihaiensis]|uniref:dTDP-4-dehydrorhamnose 3,5-epimerase n=1 Tax=Mongoliitalea daihaiensis TaxID=2782006 RepID=UPI001F23298F|nr:dTDP-4-dehydrorhamnose 3,5-epimerase [Mongoliitalea daihaiensis]UJP65791.1 dTDP-4-dehydrorhamnose 3,5-epimerase [Mongoliitalea daihaiensis]